MGPPWNPGDETLGLQSGEVVMRGVQWVKVACSVQSWQLQWGIKAAVCRISMQSVNLGVQHGLAVDMQQLQCGAGGRIEQSEQCAA